LKLRRPPLNGTEGTVNKLLGDGVMATFGAPVMMEDHAVRACRCALEIQATLGQGLTAANKVKMRIGINSGVEPCSSIAVPRTAGFGASSSLPDASAKVGSRRRQRSLSLGSGAFPSCPFCDIQEHSNRTAGSVEIRRSRSVSSLMPPAES
jgi:hypothetical protein